ncbi:MAG: GH36-type glycosyl hydrolase domain-containing protein [Acidobacteriaceae bacterium]
MKKNLPRAVVTRRTFLGNCGLIAAASALHPDLLQASNGNPASSTLHQEKPYGSGHFGEWTTDEFGLPAFRYTCDQVKDPKAISSSDPVFRSTTDQTHQVGNDRLVAAVSNYGYVQVRQDEGSPKFLNDYAPERNQFGAGLGYLTDGSEMLSTFYPGSGKSFERIFGVGYLRKQVAGTRYSIDQVLFAPFGDDPVMVSQVTITNHGESPAELRWVEYWGCQMYQFSYRSWLEATNGGGISGKAVELRRNFSDRYAHAFHPIEGNRGLLETKHFQGRTAEDERLWQAVQDATAASSVGDFTSIPSSVGGASMEDLAPPGTFLASLDGPAQGFATNGHAFFGPGGARRPTGLAGELDGNLSAEGPESALLLERKISLKPGQSETLHFLYGYLPKGFELTSLLEKYQKEVGGLWAQSSSQWKKSGMRLSTPSEPWVEREITWSHYYLRSNLTYDDFFEEHILSQGGTYQYPWGFQGAARDPLQHVLPFVFSDPEIVKTVLRYTLKEVRPNGSIPYGIVGHGMQMPTSQDDSSDMPLWLIWVVCEYVLATRDVAFLDEEVPTNMVCGPSKSKTSVRNLLAQCYRHMVEDVGTGPHRLIRMLMDDWADGLVYAAVPMKRREEYIREGESVFNSAMAAYVFDHYARLLDYTGGEADLQTEVGQMADKCRQAVQAQWTGRWFRRAWLGPHSGWLGSQNLWIEPQPWAIIGGAATSSQSRQIVLDIDAMLRRPSSIGALTWSRGVGPTRENAEPGGPAEVAPALNGTLIWALAMVDGKMAWDEWKKNSLARHAEVYPEVWYGVWSGPDSYNGPADKFPGRRTPSAAVLGTGKNDFSDLDFPVMNMHPHAWPLYSAAKLLGIEFTKKGVSIRPALPLPAYSFTSPLIGFEKSSEGYEGWYGPPASTGAWTLTLQLQEEEVKKFTRVKVNGAEVSPRLTLERAIEIEGVSAPGKPLRWSMRA